MGKGFKGWVVLIGLCLLVGSARADRLSELYGPERPADAAFIRVLNLTDNDIALYWPGQLRKISVAPKQLSDYQYIPYGRQPVALGSRSHTIDLAKHQVQTLVYDGHELRGYTDIRDLKARTAQVTFYNMSPQASSLTTLDGRVTVVGPIASEQQQSVQVNELKVQLAAYQDNNRVFVFEPMLLRRGQSYSYFLAESNSNEQWLGLVFIDAFGGW